MSWNVYLTVKLNDISFDAEKQIVREVVSDITNDVSAIVKESEAKVVTITSNYFGKSIGSGSGAIYRVDGKDVYIITNNHVIEDGNGVIVIFHDGSEAEATVLGSDVYADLAVLKVSGEFDAVAFSLGDSSFTKKGEYVIAMGSPLGIEYSGSVSGGLISGVDRSVEIDINNDGLGDWDMILLQTDAAINPGNSGGALINMQGELIGINSMKYSSTEVEGFGFAIPINEAIPIIEQLEKYGSVKRPVLGINVQEVSSLSYYEKSEFDLDRNMNYGLVITKVNKASPALDADLKVGDVIVKFDGEEVNEIRTFRKLLYHKLSGNEIILEIKRGDELLEIHITLE